MARIRSVHPGQWTDVGFVSCSPLARLLAIGLRNEADDHGVFVWDALQLKMRILPADNVDVLALLDELLKYNQVRKFADQSAKEYGVIRNFRRWQRPEKPKFLYPFPDNVIDYAGHSPKDGDQTTYNRRSVDDLSPTDTEPERRSRRHVADQSANSSPEVTGTGTEGGGGTGRAGPRDAPAKLKKTRLETMLAERQNQLDQEVERGQLG